MLLTIDVPPGMVRVGTDLQQSGRWRDGSLVRWRNGVMQPVGPWYLYHDQDFATKQEFRSAFSWAAHTEGLVFTAWGASDYLWVEAIYRGNDGSTANDSRLISSTVTSSDLDLWHFDSWGDSLVCVLEGDGDIYVWTCTNPGTVAGGGSITQTFAVATNSPSGQTGLVVTDERFLFTFANKTITWCDREDYTTWTPAATNEAGSFTLSTNGTLVSGKSVPDGTLIFTDEDAWIARYIGSQLVYGFDQVGTNCGIAGPNCAAVTPVGTFWMGSNGFFVYNGGQVMELPCDVSDFVLPQLWKYTKRRLSFAVHNARFNEVSWHFMSESVGDMPDRYVTYNYTEKHWAFGYLTRSAGVSQPIADRVYMAKDNQIYEHDSDNASASRDGASVYAESGPISLGDGERVYMVNQAYTDEKTEGDVELTFKTRFHPNDTERSYGPYTPATPMNVRFTGRQVRMRVDEAVADADWRFGVQRLKAVPGGER